MKLPPFESEGRTVKQGLATADDFRFVRAWWEVDADRRLDPIEGGAPDWREDLEGFQKWCRKRTHQGKYWVPFAKGGEYSPYYSDIHLVVNWKNEGEEIKNNLNERGEVRSNVNMLAKTEKEYFFRPGVTWLRRTRRLTAAFVPPGCIFSNAAQLVICDSDNATMLSLATMNSSFFDYLVRLFVGRTGADVQFETGMIGGTPDIAADIPSDYRQQLRELTGHLLWLSWGMLSAGDETSPRYDVKGAPVSEGDWARAQKQVDSLLSSATVAGSHSVGPAKAIVLQTPEARGTFNLTGFLVGLAFSRWDTMRSANTGGAEPTLDGPIPVSPASRIDHAGEAASSVASLLVDDPGHELDLTGAIERTRPDGLAPVHNAELRVVSSASESELRNHLSQPNGFFAEHLAGYTRSRRRAPIYWPLSTASGSYTIWLYYPRLDETTLYTAYQLAREKYDLLEKELVELQAIPSGDRTKQQQKRFDEVVRDVAEVHEFAEEILRITKLPYKPDHDDGVPICAAPLYKLFRHNAWSKYLQGIWEDLESGKYDWAHLAYAIWPDRVREKAGDDKSIAIAHGLEAEA